MSKLIYFMPTSLDGFLADENGDLNWAVPDEAVMQLINEQMRPIGTYLVGRKMYETMKVWQTPEVIPNLTAADMDFAQIWQGVDKIVYSKTLEAVSTPKTRLERAFDVQAVRDMKAHLPHDMAIEGPTLAAQAIRAGLVDEFQLLVAPAMIGGGIRILPTDISIKLQLVDERRVGNGWVFLHYRTQA